MSANRVPAAIAELRRRARLPLNPERRGPVSLDRLFQAESVTHIALAGLSLAAAAKHLIEERYVNGPKAVADMLEDEAPLVGLMYWQSGDGIAFVKGDDILPRRRFTAAHELGHALLHRGEMEKLLADVTINETAAATDPREVEANRFAAELLMPEEVIRVRAEELKREHMACPRGVLVYRLASELLVSREAMRYRLDQLPDLGVDDE